MGLRKKLGIEYERLYSLGGKFFDFYLPKQNALVEVDGIYWHGKNLKYYQKSVMQMKNAANDMYKDELAKRFNLPLHRFWLDELTLSKVKKRILLETVR